jgi:methyl-accepting chemotaxis protein
MFNKLKIRAKLLISFTIVGLIVALVGLYSIRNINSLATADKAMYETVAVPLGYAADINYLTQAIRINYYQAATSYDSLPQANAFLANISDNVEALQNVMDAYEGTIIDDVDRKNWLSMQNAIDEYTATESDYKQIIASGNHQAIKKFVYVDMKDVVGNLGQARQLLVNYMIASGEEMQKSNTQLAGKTSKAMIIIILFAFAIAIGFGVIIATNIQRIIRSIVSQTKSLVEAAVGGNLDSRANVMQTNAEFREITQGINDTLDAVINPLNVAAEYIDRISKGDIPAKITDNYNGDFNEIKNNLNGCIDAVTLLVEDANMLTEAAAAGQLDVRADASKHQGDFLTIVDGVNKTLDAVINPLNVAAEYVDRISKGDIPAKITDNYNGDFNEIKNNLNLCIDSLNGLIDEMNHMSEQHDLGDIDIKIDAEKFEGAYHKMAQGVNDMVFGHIAVKKKAMACVKEFGEGNFDAELEQFPGKKAFINDTVEQVRSNLKALIIDANMLVDAAVDGKLDVRADASAHQGDFRKIVQGVNDTLDAVINPLNVAAEYVDRISKGDVPAKITDTYKGDFNEIKNNLNGCIDAVNQLVSDAGILADAAIEGKLNTRADAGKHQGDFKAIVDGVNNTLDTLVGLLDNMPAPAMIIDKDFTIQYMNETGAKLDNKNGKDLVGTKCYDHFKTKDCRTSNCACAKTMSSGQFTERSTQANPGNLNLEIDYSAVPVKDKKGTVIGAFEVVNDQTAARNAMKKAEKVNQYQLVEANKLTEALDRFAKGDLEFKLATEKSDDDTVDAKAIFDNINEAVTTTADKVKMLIDDTNVLAEAAVEGKLTTRADANNHHGDFRKIVEGVNNTLDAVIGPLNVAATYVAKISVGDMPEKITDNYNGDFNMIKENLNTLIGALNEIIEKAQMVADGDLTVDLKKRSENDELMESLNEMVKSTASIISEFQNASENISASSQQMSSTSQQISQGATEQASSAEEVSSSMEQMLANIQQNTDNAQQTEKIALNASEGIQNVSKASNETLKFMQEIADKISIIGEISRETNILALNAAVEAARAGEHGKGFAVVAAEVRKLAERSQISAVEIDELTKNSVKATDESSKLLEAIAPEIGKTAKLVQEIAAASIEQSSGADQVNNAIQQLNQVTQQNAAASEEMATSSEEQASQSEQLLEMISFFKLLEEKGKKRNATRKNENAVSPAIKSKPGSNGHAKSSPKKPAPAKSSTDENKKVIIDMGKDNLDKNYETF